MWKFVAGIVFTLVVLAAGWYAYNFLLPVPIEDLLANPGNFEGRVVTIKGVVTESVSVFVLRYYSLDDGTGEITVIPTADVPAKGAEVSVRGSLQQTFQLGDRQLLVFAEEQKGEPARE